MKNYIPLFIQILLRIHAPIPILEQLVSFSKGWSWLCFYQMNATAPHNERSTLVQVMAWCRQATSHYLSQCWPSSMSPYGVTRPQWVNRVIYCYKAIIWPKSSIIVNGIPGTNRREIDQNMNHASKKYFVKYWSRKVWHYICYCWRQCRISWDTRPHWSHHAFIFMSTVRKTNSRSCPTFSDFGSAWRFFAGKVKKQNKTTTHIPSSFMSIKFMFWYGSCLCLW